MINVEPGVAKTKRGIGALSKFYVLIFATALSGFFASYSLTKRLYGEGAILLILFLTLFIVNALLVSTKKQIAIGALLSSVAFALPFVGLFSLYFIVGFAILFSFLFVGADRARLEMDNMVKIKFAHLVRVVSRSAITAVLIFLGIVVILSSNFSVSRESIERVLILSSPVIERFFEGFEPTANTGELLTSYVVERLAENEEYLNLSEREKGLVLDEQVDALFQRIEESTGVKLKAESSVAENLYEIVDTKLSSFTPRMQIYWGATLIGILLVSVASVGFIIHIPLAILVFLVYELLFAVKFATLQMETRSKEVILLK